MSFRTEQKLTLNLYQLESMRRHLSNLDCKELHPKREINSLYFDTFQLKSFVESEEGLQPRKKIRVRDYGTKTRQLECKFSTVEGRFKTTEKISEDYFLSISKNGMLDTFYGLLSPIVWISYEREYFFIGPVRVTIDTKLSFKKFNSSVGVPVENFSVMELKVGAVNVGNQLDSLFPFHKTRYSKYSEAIKALTQEGILLPISSIQ